MKMVKTVFAKRKKLILISAFIVVIIFIVFKCYSFRESGYYVIDTNGRMLYYYGSWGEQYISHNKYNADGLMYRWFGKNNETKCAYYLPDGSYWRNETFNEGEIYDFEYEEDNKKNGYYFVVKGDQAQIYDVEGNLTGTTEALAEWDYFQSNGLACVKDRDTGLYGCIDITGKYVIEPKYERYIEFDSKGMATIYQGDKTYFIDEKGNVLTQLEGVCVYKFNGEDCARYKNESTGYYGYIDRDGNFVTDAIFKKDNCYDFHDGFAKIIEDGQVKFINTKGEPLETYSFADAKEFSNGFAAVQDSNGLWGYIDKTGEYIIPPKYEGARSFGECGYAWVVRKKEECVFVDKKGNESKMTYKEVWSDFSPEGIALVKVGNNFGYIKTDGTWLLRPQFDEAYEFVNGYAFVHVKKGQSKFLRKWF